MHMWIVTLCIRTAVCVTNACVSFDLFLSRSSCRTQLYSVWFETNSSISKNKWSWTPSLLILVWSSWNGRKCDWERLRKHANINDLFTSVPIFPTSTHSKLKLNLIYSCIRQRKSFTWQRIKQRSNNTRKSISQSCHYLCCWPILAAIRFRTINPAWSDGLYPAQRDDFMPPRRFSGSEWK